MESPNGIFYIRPDSVLKTSAEIISEARAAMTTRPVNTKRPFTPHENHRTLFGSLKANSARPPSAISLRQVKFQDIDNVKLPPLRSASSNSKSQSRYSTWRLPNIPRVSSSLGNLPEEVESELYTEIGCQNNLRETHSSPKERTNLLDQSISKLKHPLSSGKLWLNKERVTLPHRNKYQNKKKCHLYRPILGQKLDAHENLAFGSIINESDETTEDLPLYSKSSNENKPIFNKLLIKPHSQAEIDVTLADNRINEKKANKIKQSQTTNVDEILNSINHLYGKDDVKEEMLQLLNILYMTLGGQIRSLEGTKMQSQVIKVLYKFVETADDTILLHISRIILLLKVNGQNLSAITKLIFKVSRTDKNDGLFLEGGTLELFVESMGRASPLDDAEACIYGYGALKFLTMNKELLLISLKLGILELMVLHLKIVNNARLELLSIPEQTNHAMFQLTGALRNVASQEITLKHFIQTGAIAELCTSMELFSADLDLISNIARTLSIISTHNDCCSTIVEHESSFSTISKILFKYPGRQDIVVRLGYALGNIVANNDASRVKLFQEKGAISTILNVLESYLERDLALMTSPLPEVQGIQSPEWGSDGSVEDVIIKMIRIIANMSMHPEVGTGMTCSPVVDPEDSSYAVDQHHSRDGGRFIDMLLMILRRKSVVESEELVMSALSTLNNLSYYAEPSIAAEGPFALRQIEIAQVLTTILLTRNEESMIEATRVLGNLTRSKDIRDYILEIGVVGQLVSCLGYNNKDLLFTTTGVLVNLMADWDKRLAFKDNDGIQRLINVLKQSEDNWKIANIVCQALWNFCIDSTHLYAAFGIQSTNNLLSILVDLLDEERLFGVSEGSEVPDSVAESIEYQTWEQFAVVATNLLEKIERYLESINNGVMNN